MSAELPEEVPGDTGKFGAISVGNKRPVEIEGEDMDLVLAGEGSNACPAKMSFRTCHRVAGHGGYEDFHGGDVDGVFSRSMPAAKSGADISFLKNAGKKKVPLRG